MTSKSRALSPDELHGTLAVIRRLITEQGLVHWKKYVLALIMMGVAAGSTALSAQLIGKVVNEAYVSRSFQGVLWLGIATVVLFLVKGLATYGQAVLLANIGNRIIASNQQRVFSKLLRENLAFFSERHSTEFVARLTTGTVAVTQMLGVIITAVGRDLITLVALVTVMVIQDPVMSLFSFVVAPPAFLVLRKLVSRIRKIAHTQFHGNAKIIETMQETLQGIRVVKAFTLEDKMRDRFDRHVAQFEAEANKMARVGNRASPLMETLGGIAIASAIVYGGYRVIETGAAPGEFFSFIAAFLLAYEPAKRLSRLNIEITAGLVGVRLLFEILDSPATEPDDSDKPALVAQPGRIEFSNVEFAYRADAPILRAMNFVAEAGKLTALVGPSGGGKSTVLNLLLRFYEPSAGVVTIDGKDIMGVSRRSLRDRIAYVGQDVFLFRGTIRENIAFGKPGATDADIEAAAKAAIAHDFIMSFPQGYDTPVGERGLELSGGQRQRIAIARALIRNAPIILLDEATAALDSESELLVREAMDHLCQGRTTLAIAHRLHTIAHADCIHVVENGTVTESGTHSALLAQDGRYASFYRLQLKDQEIASPPVTPAAG